MKILALIPARGGSKRLPGKNIRLLDGLPLIAWSIRAASSSGVCAEIRVSTDDPEIARIARLHGAVVPALRPASLATDTASSVDVALHALEDFESGGDRVDGLLLLQPTSPFRRAEGIRQAVSMFAEAGGRRPVVSVSPAASHPAWCFRVEAGGLEPFLGWEPTRQRSQDLPPAWVLNGSLYLISPEHLRQERSFLTRDTLPLFTEDPNEAIDIDTPDDWERAEAVIRDRSQ